MKKFFVCALALLCASAVYTQNITESNFLTELPNARFNHLTQMNDVVWMVHDNRIYLIIGGIPNVDNVNLSLLEFNPFNKSIDLITGGVPLTAQFGTDTQGTVLALAVLRLGDAHYVAAAGTNAAVGLDTFTIAIYRFLESSQQLLRTADSFQNGSTVNSVAWYGISADEIYLAVGANTGGGGTTRVLTFNMQTEVLEDPAVVVGPHGGNVLSVSWTKVGDQAFLAIGGDVNAAATTRLYTFVGQPTPTLTLVASKNHTDTVRSVDWVSLGNQRYLATGGNDAGGIQVRVYRLDATTPDIVEVATHNFGVSVSKVQWLNYGGELYLLMVTDVNDGAGRIVKFNPASNTLTTVFNLPAHGDGVEGIAWLQYGAPAYLATAAQLEDNITNRVFQVNFNTDAINALMRRKYFQNYTNTAPEGPLAIVSL